MNVFLLIFFSIIASYFTDIVFYIINNNILPKTYFLNFNLKYFVIIFLLLFFDYLLFRMLLKRINIFVKKIYAFVYIPLILFFTYRLIYGKLNFLNRTINDPLKEIKYLLGLIIILIAIFKLFYLAGNMLSSLKKKELFTIKIQINLIFIFIYVFTFPALYKFWYGSVGDEKEYVINLYSLSVDGNMNLVDDIKYMKEITGGSEHAPPLNFYPQKIYSLHSNLFPLHFLLLPAFVSAGRLGVILFITLLSAYMSVLMFKNCYYICDCQKTAFIYWLVCALSPFFIIYNYQIYPEILAAFFNILFVLLLREQTKNNIKNNKIYYFILFAAPLMLWFNFRYIFFGAAYMFIYFIRIGINKMLIKKNIALIVLFIISILIYLIINGAMYNSFSFSANTRNYETQYVSNKLYITIFGIFFDRHFGLLIYIPFILYCFFGFFKNMREFYVEFVIIIFYLFPLSFYTGNWFGGFSPPMRLIAPVIPLFFIMGADVFGKILNMKISKIIYFIFLFYSFLMSIILFSTPVLLYNERLNGNNQIFEKIFWFTGFEFNRFFPVFVPNRITDYSYKLVFSYFIIAAVLFIIYNYEAKKCVKP